MSRSEAPPAPSASPNDTTPDAAQNASPERIHVAPQRPPEESKYKTLELRSFEVDAEDARHAATRRIERDQVRHYVDKYGLGGALPPNSPLPLSSKSASPSSPPPAVPQGNGPASAGPSSTPAPSQRPPAAVENYTWLWAAVLVGAVVVGVLVGLALLEVR